MISAISKFFVSGVWQADDLANYAENVTQKLEQSEAEVKRLSELLWGSRCVYCGEVVGKDKQNQEIADDFLRKHIEVCPKHPGGKWLRLIAGLQTFLDGQEVTSENIGDLRRRLLVPWDSHWNMVVRDETASREV